MRIEQFLSDSAQRLGPVPAIVAAGRSQPRIEVSSIVEPFGAAPELAL